MYKIKHYNVDKMKLVAVLYSEKDPTNLVANVVVKWRKSKMTGKKITVLASNPNFNKECDDFTVLSIIIYPNDSIDIMAAGYDNSAIYTKLSKILSKMPGIKHKSGITIFQTQMEMLKECINNADEIIVGGYKRDIGLINKLYRKYKGTSINEDSDFLIRMQDNIRELFYELPDSEHKLTYRKLAEWNEIDPHAAASLAGLVFDEEYWEDMPASAIQASLLLLIRLNECGYEQWSVVDTIEKYMDDYYAVGVVNPCYLEKEAFYG